MHAIPGSDRVVVGMFDVQTDGPDGVPNNADDLRCDATASGGDDGVRLHVLLSFLPRS